MRTPTDTGPVVITLDATGRVETDSPRLRRLLGLREVVGRPFATFVATPSKDVFRRLLRLVGAAAGPTWSSLWLRAPAGAVRCLVRVVPDHAGERARLILELRDGDGGSMPRLATSA